MTGLGTVSLGDPDLVEVTQSETDMAVNVDVPFTPELPATTRVELEGGRDVVADEIEPSKHRVTIQSI